MKTTPNKQNDPLKPGYELGYTKLRKTDIDVIKGAQQTDQLEALKANALKHKCSWRHKSIVSFVIISAVIGTGLLMLSRRLKPIC